MDPDDQEKDIISQYGVGAQLLMRMGYKVGEGLGKNKEGIAAPVDVKMRPRGLGLAYGGFDEKVEPASTNEESEPVYDEPKVEIAYKKRRRHVEDVRPVSLPSEEEINALKSESDPISVILQFAEMNAKSLRVQSAQLLSEKRNIDYRERALTAQLAQLEADLLVENNTLNAAQALADTSERIQVMVKECMDVASVEDSYSPQVALSSALRAIEPLITLLDVEKSVAGDIIFASLVFMLDVLMPKWSIFEEPGFLVDDIRDVFGREIIDVLSFKQIERLSIDFVYPRARHLLDNEWQIDSSGVLLPWFAKWTGFAVAQQNLFRASVANGSALLLRKNANMLLRQCVFTKIQTALRYWNPLRDSTLLPAVVSWLKFFREWDDYCADMDESDTSDSDADPAEVGISVTGGYDPFFPLLLEQIKTKLLVALGKWRLSGKEPDWALPVFVELSSALSTEFLQTVARQKIYPQLVKCASSVACTDTETLSIIGNWFSTGYFSQSIMLKLLVEYLYPNLFQQVLDLLYCASPKFSDIERIVALLTADGAEWHFPAELWSSVQLRAEQRKLLEIVERWSLGLPKLVPKLSAAVPVKQSEQTARISADELPKLGFKDLVFLKLAECGALTDSSRSLSVDGRPVHLVTSKTGQKYLFYLWDNVIFAKSLPHNAYLLNLNLKASEFEPIALNRLIQNL